jgi:hypothetical protein
VRNGGNLNAATLNSITEGRDRQVPAFSRAGGAAVVAVPGTKKPDTELVQLPTNLRGSPAPTGSTNIQIRYLLIRGS